jgi:cobalt-zinc-cadmium efflux system protein
MAVLLLHKHGRHDLNVRSIFLHLIQDAVSSLIVLLAAILAKTAIGRYLDPVAAIIIAVAVIAGALPIVKEAVIILLEGAPDDIRIDLVSERVQQHFHPARMHHLHAWQVGPGQRALTAHLAVRDMRTSESESLCRAVRLFLLENWNIQHVTLELETTSCGSDTVLGNWAQVCGQDD